MPRRKPTDPLPFTQPKRGKWRGWAFLGPSENRKRVFGPCFATQHEAYLWALRARQIDREEPVRVLSLREASELVLASARRSCSPGTVRWYRDQFRAILHPVHGLKGDLPLDGLDHQTIGEFVDRRQQMVSSATLQHHRRALHRLFVLAAQAGFVGVNPIPAFPWPKQTATTMDFFELGELRKILLRIKRESLSDYDLVMLIAYTGLRRGELDRLSAEDVDLAKGLLWVDGKARKETVQVPPDLVESMTRLLAASPDGLLVSKGAKGVSACFRRWAKKLKDRRFHAHALRHTLATEMLRSGERPEVVKRFMRHKAFATTLRYVHITSPELRAAAKRLHLASPVKRRARG